MSVTTLKAGLKAGAEGEAVSGLQSYLYEFGYLALAGRQSKTTNVPDEPEPPLAESAVFDAATLTALQSLQSRAGLAPTGELDEPTMKLIGTPRCGMGEPRGGRDDFRVAGGWSRSDLTYGFENLTPELPADVVRAALAQAAQLWSEQCGLTLNEVGIGQNPDLRIRFHRREDIFDSFDGAGGVLAHAFYPENGDIHFDEDETWTVDLPPSGIDLVTVAAHELGHSLGLDHSQIPEAVMWPWIGGPRRALHDDDIEAIRFLYGEPDLRELARMARSPLTAATRRGGLLSLFGTDFGVADNTVELRQRAGSTWREAQLVRIAGSARMQGRLAVAANTDGRLELFGRGVDDALWHTWQEGGADGPWHAWESLGGRWTSDPAVAANQDGRLEVFLRGTESGLWRRNQLWAGGPWAPTFSALEGVMTSEPSVVRRPDGALQVFARGADNAIWTRSQEGQGGAWRQWSPAAGGSFAGGPAAFVDSTGMVLVFATGLDRKPWVIWGRGGDEGWSGPLPHGSADGGELAADARIDAAVNAVGGLELFARFADGTLRHRYQVPAPDYWSDWQVLGGPIRSDPTVAKRGSDGRLEIFALNAPLAGVQPFDRIFHRQQTVAGWV